MINKFRGKYFFLSNYANSKITLNNGKTFPTAEHLFAACKTTNKEDQEKIRLAKTPGDAKRLGRQVKLIENWNDIRIDIMGFIVHAKFSQNEMMRDLLILTGEEELIEGNTWHDNFWGNCTCPKCKNIEGQNNLGKILMEERNQYIGIMEQEDERSIK